MSATQEQEQDQDAKFDADGFRLLTCATCGKEKLATLFQPSSVRDGRPKCVACGSKAGCRVKDAY